MSEMSNKVSEQNLWFMIKSNIKHYFGKMQYENWYMIKFARSFIFILVWKKYNSIEVDYGLESWRVVKELQ